jgi:hypothetical protein
MFLNPHLFRLFKREGTLSRHLLAMFLDQHLFRLPYNGIFTRNVFRSAFFYLGFFFNPKFIKRGQSFGAKEEKSAKISSLGKFLQFFGKIEFFVDEMLPMNEL